MILFARSRFLCLFIILLFPTILPATFGYAKTRVEKIDELRSRSREILASLDGLDAKLKNWKSAISQPKDQSTLVDEFTEEEISPSVSSEPALPRSETFYDSYPEDEEEFSDQNHNNTRMGNEDFDYVIEKYEGEEFSEIQEDGNANERSPTAYRRSRGDYYLIFSAGIQFASDLDFHHDGLKITGEIETNTGYATTMELGRSFGMFEIGLLAGFCHQELSTFNGSFASKNHISSGEGEISNYYLAVRPSFFFELSDLIGVRAGTSFGFSSRHINYSLQDPYIELHEAGVGFLWDLHSSLQLGLWDSGGVFLGYRFAYIGDTGDFDALSTHALELGARWGF